MALQKVFIKSYADELRTHIDPVNYYGEEFEYDKTKVKFLSRIPHPQNLASYMEEHADNDCECAIALYEAYKDISPVFAQEERLWVYLSHVELFTYLKKRWSIKDEKDQLNFIRNHWFRSKNGLMRSSLMGLWWAVYCTIDENGEKNGEDKYRLTRILFSNYSFRTTFFGASELFWYRDATRGILRFLVDNPEIIKNNFENRSQFITKYFNQLGGIKQLSALDEDYYYNECVRIKGKILAIRLREDIQNKNALTL